MTGQLLLAICLFLLNTIHPVLGKESTCYGTTGHGRLESGVELPKQGVNFEAYSTLARTLGRTYVHSTVRDVVLEAYQILEEDQPGKVYKYAETGFEEGGRFRPHKTHQNGLSVDFIVPVVNEQGESVPLPTNILNKYGYNIEFDRTGRYEEYTIDYESLGAHIVALHKAAQNHKIGIWRVIFAPDLQPYLYMTKYGEYIEKHIQVLKKRSWVRHDDHYHVDFIVKCHAM
ncbi:MAG: penicillin-insensitive murein endopeptidase [Gammaproteobacteria bacterium]|jgi:penicillin-insensitive murein endopeptidase